MYKLIAFPREKKNTFLVVRFLDLSFTCYIVTFLKSYEFNSNLILD